jgi:acetoin utilization deacetylase AcuC-like enzyme
LFKIAWSPVYCLPLPEGHRFPMQKYNLLPEQLMYEGTIHQNNLFEPSLIRKSDALLTHTETWWNKLENMELSASEIRKTGFPLTKELMIREKTIMQGTIDAALFALEFGVAMNIAGGTHHAFTDKGEGFCLLNDNAIAAHYLLAKKLKQKILIVDLDVHQGNGTAEIFSINKNVFTFSMHGKKNYPFHKEQSDLDLELEDGTDDKTYLSILDLNLKKVMDSFQPDFIFYQSGVDVIASDKLGKLGMTIAGCKQRDRIVLETAKKNQIPLSASMGGGYSVRIADIVEAHANTYRLAQEIFF